MGPIGYFLVFVFSFGSNSGRHTGRPLQIQFEFDCRGGPAFPPEEFRSAGFFLRPAWLSCTYSKMGSICCFSIFEFPFGLNSGRHGGLPLRLTGAVVTTEMQNLLFLNSVPFPYLPDQETPSPPTQYQISVPAPFHCTTLTPGPSPRGRGGKGNRWAGGPMIETDPKRTRFLASCCHQPRVRECYDRYTDTPFMVRLERVRFFKNRGPHDVGVHLSYRAPGPVA
jgi:hypothetical protein